MCMSVHTGEVIVGPIGADPRRDRPWPGGRVYPMADELLRLAEPGAMALSAAQKTGSRLSVWPDRQ